jgi:type II secretory pathway component PulF
MFFRRAALVDLIDWCRSLRHMQEAGLTLAGAMQVQSQSGPRGMQAVSARVAGRLERGEDLASALALEADRFPPLFLAMARVGEESGQLPEVLGELEEFFTLQWKLRKRFLSQIAWPVFQFAFAVLVIAGLIWILGMIAEVRPGAPAIAPIGFGLTGGRGAVIFLGVVVGVLLGSWGFYRLLRRLTRRSSGVDGFLLRLPLLGPCLEALALARFSLSLHLTTESAMPIHHALRLSLKATGNQAFTAAGPAIAAHVKGGNEVGDALRRTGRFPGEYLAVVDNAELTGQLSEVMKKQAMHYSEEASRRLGILATVAARLVYALVGIFIIIVIFKLFSIYLSALPV